MKLIGVDELGFLKFDHHFYFVGSSYIGKQVVIENILDETLKIMDNNYKEIYSYPIDHDKLSSSHYHKPDHMKSEMEKIISRDKQWFIDMFSQFGPKANHIVEAVNFIFEKLDKATPVATRKCNELYRLYDKNKDKLEVLNLSCDRALQPGNINNFTELVKSFFLIFKDGEISLKQKQDLIGIAASNDVEESESLRGGKAFED